MNEKKDKRENRDTKWEREKKQVIFILKYDTISPKNNYFFYSSIIIQIDN